MPSKRKTWAEKMKPGHSPKVEVTEKDFADIPAGSTMFIATPEIVDDYVRHIPEGHTTDIRQMRKDLAAANHAEYTCPVTSGIFLRIVAEKAWEDLQQGKPAKDVTPFWRIIDTKSPTAKKLTFGTAFLAQQRAKEGLD